MGTSPGRQHHCSKCKLDPSNFLRKQGENWGATVGARRPTQGYLRPVPLQRTAVQRPVPRRPIRGAHAPRAEQIGDYPKERGFGKSRQAGLFRSTTGLRREGAIPCHVANKNTIGNSRGPFVLEGVTDRGRQKGPPREGSHINERGIGT